jgi:hypothetical protein
VKATRTPKQRVCLDCGGDITGSPSRRIRCKPCAAAHLKEWDRDYHRERQRQSYAADPEIFRERSRRNREVNADRLREYDRAYYQQNKERAWVYKASRKAENQEYERRRYQENREAELERARRRREENPDYKREWRHANPIAVRAQSARRRARRKLRMSRYDSELSRAYREAIANDPCFYCGAAGEQDDHYVSLARGGTDHWWNLVRACQRCNCQKCDRSGDEFIAMRAARLSA